MVVKENIIEAQEVESMEENLPKRKQKKPLKTKKELKEPLSKRQELNNHIVCMRKKVAQSRVQIIVRLIAQIKRYRNRKGDPKNQEKAKKKADRLLQEIQVLKKIKKDKVSLYALQVTHKLEAVLNNPKSCSQERVLARLSHHPVIAKEVKIYRDANPNWDKQIPVLIQMTWDKRGKKAETQNSTGTSTSTFKKTQEKKSVTKTEAIIINQKTDDDDNVNGEADSDVNEDEDINSEVDSNDDDVEEEEEEEQVEIKESEQPTVSKSTSKPGQKKPRKKSKPGTSTLANDKTHNISSAPLPVINKSKSEGTVKVQFLTDLNELEEGVTEQKSEKATFDITRIPNVKKPKSAFFVGGVDAPEESGVDVYIDPRIQRNSFQKSASFNNHQNNGPSKPVYKKGKLISKPPPRNRFQGGGDFRQNQEGQHHSFRENRTGNNHFGVNTQPLGAKKPGFSSGPQEGRYFKPSAPPSSQYSESGPAEKLHPSWEAKKKQQQISLTEFKGKKIVFGDDD